MAAQQTDLGMLQAPAGQPTNFQSTAATLEFEHADTTVTDDVVVDTGAAYAGIDFDHLVGTYPELARSLRSCERAFVNASGNPMPVKGEVDMTFRLGRKRIHFTAVVFTRLPAKILLGTNAMADNKLVVNYGIEQMYVCDDWCAREDAVGLKPRRDPHTPPAQAFTGWAKRRESSCKAAGVILTIDSSGTLQATGSPCDCSASLGEVQEVREARAPYSAQLHAAYDYVLEPGSKGVPVLLDYSQHATNPECTELELQFCAEFMHANPDVLAGSSHEVSQRVNACNRHAFVHLSNLTRGAPIHIKKGQRVAEVHEVVPPAVSAPTVTTGVTKVPLAWQEPEEGSQGKSDKDFMLELGLDLEDSIDPLRKNPDGTYARLTEEQKSELYKRARRWHQVWSRDARTPETSRLVVLSIPTGDAEPIAQRPYPIAYKYKEAVIDELKKLLAGGLIEPTISAWASPILVRLKKDSTPDNIRLKIIVDYRRLNEVTIPDAAGLGDMAEILDGFGGSQKYGGIMDAAGGFYQFPVAPGDRPKTAFCLPTSMGGTSFQ